MMMQTQQVSPIQASRPSMDLLLTSNMAPTANSYFHDPANFIVRLPNSTVTNKVVKCIPKLIAIPRMFNNVDETNNKLVVTYGTGGPDNTTIVVIPPALYTAERLVETLNSLLVAPFQVQLNSDNLIVPVPAVYTSAAVQVSAFEGSRVGILLGWKRLQPFPQTVTHVIPADLSFSMLPQLGGPQCVTVSLKCVGSQVINAQDGCENDTLVIVPMSCVVGETAFFQAQDIFVHDIDHDVQVRNYSVLEVHLYDTTTGHKLTLPHLLTVTILLKLFHVDTLKE